MPNPTGKNPMTPTPAYGQIKRQMELKREAPMSGAPMPAHALNTPRRSQQQASRGKQAQPEQAVTPALPPEPSYAAKLAGVYQEVAQTPGIGTLWLNYADAAQRAVNG